ncbi:unnamed protein product [Owenia fusiformis]|uniref:4'-phosphopantetheine phosphatase n=1 Tax=Owenia fusiformis TaxID=6347 RepID=A0A8S4NN32_OWEFU|nr:unnamed protein product [Owenia fusiformis]
MTDSSYSKSIEIPNDLVFKNLKSAKRFAIDIGGSLCKLAYYSTVKKKRSLVSDEDLVEDKPGSHIYKVSETDEIGYKLHFVKFETKYIEACLDFIQQDVIGGCHFPNKVIKATGGGAYKYKDLITQKLGVEVDKEDEMECLIKGCNFLLNNIPDEAFMFQRHEMPEYRFEPVDPNVFPYLLVNIGSGVSILKVESESKYERIGGTSMGGGTFWGLGSLLTQAKGFDHLLHLAEKGDHRNIDMLVKDIYGGAYSALGLPSDLIASSFGRAARSAGGTEDVSHKPEDIAKSLLLGISNDIGQIAYLNAKLHGLKKIYFGGYFIRGHPMTMHTITFAINYWSKGDIHALFLRHEGYLGAIGAFLKGTEEADSEKYSWRWSDMDVTGWKENLYSSSGLPSPRAFENPLPRDRSSTFDMFELDRYEKPQVHFPLLLDPASYFPDTEDLTQDHLAMEYWLNCFQDAIDGFVQRAISSQPNTKDAVERAHKFKANYIQKLNELRENPISHGSLTVRSLLDTREQCMEEFNFSDPFSEQKQKENEHALKQLKEYLDTLDKMDLDNRNLSLIEGLLAGNVFDWGAKEIADIMATGNFGFEQAKKKLQVRPWLFDDYDAWAERLKGPPHKCAIIFCDNSGMDIILGVVPFARQLLMNGTKVLLCANSRPALNDVTHSELIILMKKVAEISSVIAGALQDQKLQVLASGQGSPCLDLRCIDHDLAETLKQNETDLVVIEGMGRAVHTNLHSAFSCDSIKIAVLKNRWLAARLGGEMFSIMFKYERSKKVQVST